MDRARSIRDSLDRFFFAEESPAPIAAMRVLLCSALLIPVGSRWPVCRELYSTDGSPTPIWAWWPGSMELPIPSGNLCVLLYSVLVFALVAGAVGWRTRTSLLTAATLMIWFGLLDVTGTLTKYTVIAFHGLLILGCSPCGRAYSADAWLAGRGSGAGDRVEAWPRRLVQLFLCVLYFATALTKIKTPEYLTGEHTLFWFRTDMNFAHPVGIWLSTHPVLVMLSSQAALLWETLFCVAVWVRPLRPAVLALGVLFHAGTYFLLGLAVFPLVMLAFYPVFLQPRRVEAAMSAAWAAVAGRPAAAWMTRHAVAGYAMAMGVSVVVACETERLIDPFGERSAKPALPEIDADTARRLTSATAPLGPRDWVYAFTTGRTVVGGVVTGEPERFEPGQTMYLQAGVHKPHQDFTVTVLFRDEAGRTLDSATRIIPREVSRWTLPWTVAPELEPGRYAFVLDAGGEVAERWIEVR